jgi:hypothetical protein
MKAEEDNMKTLSNSIRYQIRTAVLFILCTITGYAQMNIEGEFRTRWYTDHFSQTLDGRGAENYIRYSGRILGKAKIGEQASFTTELIALTDNSSASTDVAIASARNIAGTGAMRYGISQIYAELVQPNFLVFDIARIRMGRQQFPIGNGLSFGESYIPDKFDGARVDLSRDMFTLSLFGAITGQNLSASGLYPEPGSDQVYVGRLGANIYKQDVMGYFILHKLRGDFNDSYIIGGGSSGEVFLPKLEYFWEWAYQKFNTVPGFPTKGGTGYMLGASYQWTLGPFKSVKFESRYAAYQGDDPSTPKFEQFSPLYPSFFWGTRTGYVDGDIGGDQPHKGYYLDGCRIWFTRFYVIPRIFPRVRFQVQYVKVGGWLNYNEINMHDDEIAARLYYTFSNQVQLQLRYGYTIANAGDHDLSGDGQISSSEDRYNVSSFMIETQVRF